MSTVSYLYALIRPLPEATSTLAVPGVDGAEVRVVNQPELAALVSSVAASTFSSEALRARVDDLAWLERTARAHDRVVEAAAAVTTAIPLRLGTTCPDDVAVAALLRDLRPAAQRTFARLDGRREWGVQVFANPYVPSETDVPGESGAAFLRRRRDELRRLETGQAADTAAASALYDVARAACPAAARQPLRDDQVRADGRRMVLNAVFLVDMSAEEEFLQIVRAAGATLGDDRLTITGPWAPYSFAELDRA